ncbi:DUF29 domain-containing protein [Endozoicomonas sp. 2B-B]
MTDLYRTDYHKWLGQQRDLLAQRQFDQLDIDNLLEAMELRMGDYADNLESHLVTLVLHLLKYHYQTFVINPNLYEPKTFRSWFISISNARNDISDLIKKHPHLQPRQDESLSNSYPKAKKRAIEQMNLFITNKRYLVNNNSFPDQCPWTFDQIMTEDWLPDD